MLFLFLFLTLFLTTHGFVTQGMCMRRCVFTSLTHAHNIVVVEVSSARVCKMLISLYRCVYLPSWLDLVVDTICSFSLPLYANNILSEPVWVNLCLHFICTQLLHTVVYYNIIYYYVERLLGNETTTVLKPIHHWFRWYAVTEAQSRPPPVLLLKIARTKIVNIQ